MYSSSSSLTLLVALAVSAMPTNVAATNAAARFTTASYHDYSNVQQWQTFCNIPLGDKDFISAYTNVGSDLHCGDCAEIRNVETGATRVVKIVDKGGAIFDLSWGAFHAIDTNGMGYQRGHLNIQYTKVQCP